MSILTRNFSGRMELVRCLATDYGELTRDIVSGLYESQKRLPSKYFYDAEGSRLFEAICTTPEYYLTRTESSILDERAARIMEFFSHEAGDLVEIGSGSNLKIRRLLTAANREVVGHVRYVPVDISESAMIQAATGLLELFPELKVLGILADFTASVPLISKGRKLIAFLGSSIGNFSREERVAFLQKLALAMQPVDRLLLGLDMVKPAHLIDAAYNDRQGITSQFNRNILANVNRLLNTDLVPNAFEHVAFYRNDLERVEMHLRAGKKISFEIAGMTVEIQEGETILTEICQKFTRAKCEFEFHEAGFTVCDWFTDPRAWFSVVLLAKRSR